MRYRKKKRFYRRSTNVIKMKFQSFMDVSTSDSSMQIITISAGGKEILKRLLPQFGAYKYYKIGNISAKLVPASTLPVDPTGLSYAAGEQTVDPRDQLTPGMMRITNGEDVFEDISGLDDNQQHGIFNNMLLDPRWFKFMLQNGVKRHATPRYWQIGQLHQDKWPGSTINYPILNADGDEVSGTMAKTLIGQRYVGPDVNPNGVIGSDPRGLFQVGHRGVLGWLPTDGLQPIHLTEGDGSDIDDPFLASPPEVEVMKIILPKAYKTKYYYRLFITETVYFKEPIVNFGIGYTTALGSEVSYRPLDVFHYPGPITPIKPSTPINPDVLADDTFTGGNYGGN